jgi:hypothetical protein
MLIFSSLLVVREHLHTFIRLSLSLDLFFFFFCLRTLHSNPLRSRSLYSVALGVNCVGLIKEGDRVVVIDDLIATGGSALASIKLIGTCTL